MNVFAGEREIEIIIYNINININNDGSNKTRYVYMSIIRNENYICRKLEFVVKSLWFLVVSENGC